MLSEKQRIIKINRVKKVVDTFLISNIKIKELAQYLSIPHSTIQRDLNDTETITSIYGKDSEFIIQSIKIKLEQNKKEGLSLGGNTFVKNNTPTKDELGHFTGSKRK